MTTRLGHAEPTDPRYVAEAELIRATQPIHNTTHTERRPERRLPCRVCRTGKHRACVGLNRMNRACECSVCDRAKAGAAA